MNAILHTIGCRRKARRQRLGGEAVLSARQTALRLGLPPSSFRVLLRDGVALPDFQTAREDIFREDRLPELRAALSAHPQVVA